MAIDYGNYAQQYGGQPVGFDQLNKGIATAMEANKERRMMQAQQLDDRIWNDMIMKPFSTASYGSVDTWGSNVFNMDAGKALRLYKTEALKHPKLYNILSQQGAFNPMTFKQKYDEMSSQHAPMINRKLEFFADEKGWTDRQLQQYITSTNNPGLQNFLMDHSTAGTLAHEAGKPYKNIGLFGGAYEHAMGPASMSYMGPGMGAIGGVAGEFMDKGWKGITRQGLTSAALKGANPFRSTLTPAFQKMGSKEVANLANRLKGTGFADPNMKSKLLKNAQHLQSDKSKINKLINKANKTAGHTKAKYTWRGKELGYTTKKGKVISSWQHLKNKQKAINSATKASEKAIAKAPLATLRKYVKKKGTMALVRLLSKHMGKGAAIKMAAKLAAGTMLTATGLGAGVGMALNAWTLIDIARVAANALRETGGLQRPDKMLFGE